MYLDFDKINRIDPVEFRSRRPYPWINPEGLLTKAGYRRLRDTLPDLSLFEACFGVEREYGQASHDRYALDYHDDLDVPEPWKEFVAELQGADYMAFLYEWFGTQSLKLRVSWHYTPNGCSVSPHCDAERKLGSHIFYFNTTDDWDPDWGGETVILDCGGRFEHDSAPSFEDFDSTIHSTAIGNHSLLFARNGNSWHGVREIHCPEGYMRKVFIVIVTRQLTQMNRLLRQFLPSKLLKNK